jgi:uncharacterized membrane protein
MIDLFFANNCFVISNRAAKAMSLLAALTALLVSPASADFNFCNETGDRVGVAIGYKGPNGWVTDGWWNVKQRACETLLRGPLVGRYVYIHATDYDRGGAWSGQAYMCTRDSEFTILGVKNCMARGYDRTGFIEIDTGQQSSWTVRLMNDTEEVP